MKQKHRGVFLAQCLRKEHGTVTVGLHINSLSDRSGQGADPSTTRLLNSGKGRRCCGRGLKQWQRKPGPIPPLVEDVA